MPPAAQRRDTPVALDDDGDEAPQQARQELAPAPFFRPEVIAGRRAQWLGVVLLAPRVSHNLAAAGALAAVLAVAALLVFGSYTRKATVNGWLMPQQGLVKVFAPQSGVVAKVNIHEGDHVAKGAPLLVVSGEMRSESQGDSRAQVVDRLTLRRDSMSSEAQVQSKLFETQGKDLRQRLDAIKFEEQHLAEEVSLQRQRVALAEQAARRDQAMRARDLIPVSRLEQSRQDRLDQAARLSALERQRSTTQRERAQLEESLGELPLKLKTQLGDVSRNVAAIEQDLAEADVRRAYTISAPEDGVVTGVQVEAGGAATQSAPLLSLVPEGSALVAQLFCPSRAIGFVRTGQHVLLRYQAYPYQKFGSYDGVVSDISRSALNPTELPQQISGLTSLYQANEPIYRITVTLAQQTARAYGEPAPLQPGMQLQADVLIESRRLIEWIFDPLFTLTGKWRG